MRDVSQLFKLHHEELFRYAYRLCGDSDLASDAAQEAFVRLSDNRAGSDRNIRAWLYTVTTNVVRDSMRKSNRQYRLLQHNPDRVPIADPPADPDRATEMAENKAMVRRALEEMSERDRTALLMREEGFSHQEIADAVGTTTKAVGTILARALRKLARHLQRSEKERAYDT